MMAVTQQSNYSSVGQHQPQTPSSPYNFMNSAGVYVHSNPPRPLLSSSSTNSNQNTAIRNWIKGGDVDKLENIVLEGQGARLLGLMDSTNDVKVKSFLRGIPGYMAKVDLIHDAVIRGSVRELQTLLDKKKLSLARDAVGRGLAHKAVLHSQRNVLDWLGKKYPESIQIRDNESRTCLHYAGLSKNPTEMYSFLMNLGSNPEIIDIHGRKASYYLTNPQELYIEGVAANNSGGGPPPAGTFRGNRTIKRGGGAGAPNATGGNSQGFRRRISPSPQSSPSPPTTTGNSFTGNIGLPPQHSSAGSSNLQKSFVSMLGPTTPQLTRAQIRIWIHEKDISKLEQIVWSGNGDRLLLETTNNPKVRRFLDNVPYLLHHIKLVHTAAIHNDVEGLKEIRSRIERSRDSGGGSDGNVSISPELFMARDGYGLSAMHKATGLNNRAAAEYLLYEFPGGINLQDNFKRSPLHYAAVRVANEPQNNGDASIYKFLQRAGADTSLLDYKQQDAPFYLTRPGECDSFKFLRNIPDAPRVLSSDNFLGWDRSGVAAFAAGAGVGGVGHRMSSPGSGGSKRKISDEFVDSVESGNHGKNLNEKESGEGKREEDVIAEVGKPQSSKFARTEGDEKKEEGGGNNHEDFLDDEEEEIRDVGDAYVADSDEGKYDLQAEDVVIGENDVLVEEEEENEEEQPRKEDLARKASRESPPPPSPEKHVEEEEERTEEEEKGDLGKSENFVEEESSPMKNDVPEEENNLITETEEAVPEEDKPVEEEEEADEALEKPYSPSPPPPPPDSPMARISSTAEVEEQLERQQSISQNGYESPLPPPPDYVEVAGKPVNLGTENEDAAIDANVEHYLQTSDMESLVNLVLRGRGADLVDRTSPNPEIQEFLHNVPAYMAKIATIHKASFTGNMRDLQSLLDRKRLAEAQDSSGRAALHHAILGGHSQIVRYLINGYPGCIDVQDSNGRTALHYAAVIGDEGVLYRVLIQGGADPNLRDKLGNTPGVYLRRKDLLKMEDLMKGNANSLSSKKSIGKLAGATAVDTWARQDTPYPPGERETEDAPNAKNVSVIMISPDKDTEENEAEEDLDSLELPMQNLSLLNSFYLEVLSKDTESIWSRTWKKLTTGKSGEVANKYVKRYLSPKVFHRVKMRSTPRYGSTLLDCIKFYPQFFIVAPDPHAYTCFAEVFLPAIAECNGAGQTKTSGEISLPDSEGGMPIPPLSAKHPPLILQGDGEQIFLNKSFPIVDLPSKFIHQVRVRVSRNIRPYPFIPIMKREELLEVQRIIRTVFKSEKYDWFELEGLEKDSREMLSKERGIWFPEATKISRFWPKGRSFLCDESGSVQIWINAEDHLDILVVSQYGNLHPLMEKVVTLLQNFSTQDSTEFHWNGQCGYLTVDPFRCGTGIKITFRLRLPNMMQNRSRITQKCDELKLTLKWNKKTRLFNSGNEISPDDWIEVENVATCGFDENALVLSVIAGVNALIKEEEQISREINRGMTKKKDHGSSNKTGESTGESTAGRGGTVETASAKNRGKTSKKK